MDNETRSLPMVALRGLTIMPEMIVHFDVSRERSIAAIQQAMVEEQEIFLVAQKSIETENPGQDDVYETGTVASVKQLIKLSKKVVRVLVEGKNRAVLKKIEETDPYLRNRSFTCSRRSHQTKDRTFPLLCQCSDSQEFQDSFFHLFQSIMICL